MRPGLVVFRGIFSPSEEASGPGPARVESEPGRGPIFCFAVAASKSSLSWDTIRNTVRDATAHIEQRAGMRKAATAG
jgi:hypothetical protein